MTEEEGGHPQPEKCPKPQTLTHPLSQKENPFHNEKKPTQGKQKGKEGEEKKKKAREFP